jgi:hypothetical protein
MYGRQAIWHMVFEHCSKREAIGLPPEPLRMTSKQVARLCEKQRRGVQLARLSWARTARQGQSHKGYKTFYLLYIPSFGIFGMSSHKLACQIRYSNIGWVEGLKAGDAGTCETAAAHAREPHNEPRCSLCGSRGLGDTSRQWRQRVGGWRQVTATAARAGKRWCVHENHMTSTWGARHVVLVQRCVVLCTGWW